MPALPPKITVITPSFNQGDLLEHTLRSVLDQNYPNLEYLVFDGGSTDHSVDVIRRYASRLDFWVSQKDRGQSHAINQGFQRATGEVVVWLNSDDIFHPGALDLIGQAVTAHPQAGLYIGNGTVIDRQGNHVRRYSRTLKFSYDALLRGSNFILQPSTFIHRRVIEQEGLLDESLHYAMDLEYWLRVGNKYPVVTLDRELSAYRWYADIKTASGGTRRWVEMWHILQRHSRLSLTPGLLVEFFNVLQEARVAEDAALPDVGDFARKSFWHFYRKMQPALRLDDCIPTVNEGIEFTPAPLAPPSPGPSASSSPSSPSSPAPSPAPHPARRAAARPSGPRIDLVLPDGHSWFVREGYAEALRRQGLLGRVLYVPSWGPEDARNRALFEYLRHPEADVLFSLDTLWHAQQVHATEAWRERWAACPARRVLFSFECMSNPWLRPNPRWWADTERALQRALPCADAVVFAHEIDADLFASFGVPALWQPFAVDETLFPEPGDFAARKPRALFKGKADRFYDEDRCYASRRRLIEHLRRHAPWADVIDHYQDAPGTVLDRNRRFIAEMSGYQVVIGLPSLSPTMVVRPFEAMLSGSVFLQNHIQGARTQALFRDGEHCLFYDDQQPEQLVALIDRLLQDPATARRIAGNGRREILERHTISHRVAELLPWLDALPARPPAAIPTAATTPASAPASLDVPSAAAPASRGATQPAPTIVIDGVIFDLQRAGQHGISRVWTRLLHALAQSPLAPDIVLLDRDGTAPPIDGLRRRRVPRFDHVHFEHDSLAVQRWCDEENAALFVSTYFTAAENTPGLVVLHDMIPEVTGQDLGLPEWRAKEKAILRSCAYLAVSRSTAADFQRLYPHLAERPLVLAPNAADDLFQPAPPARLQAFRDQHQIRHPYFLLVGNRALYKNAALFFRALALFPRTHPVEVLCVGGAPELEAAFRPHLRGIPCRVLRVPDHDLPAAYSGALALVYPSRYEGFGLPILEAQRCDCPVITCRNSSLPEVAGDAALFVGESDVTQMRDALVAVRQPETRNRLVAAGRANAARFSWSTTAAQVIAAFDQARSLARTLPRHASDPIDTIGRLIHSLPAQDPEAAHLAQQTSRLTRIYRNFARYDLADVNTLEADIAAVAASVLTPLNARLAAPEESDPLLSLVRGLAAEGCKDLRQAAHLYSVALKRSNPQTTVELYYRLGLRLRQVAERLGDRPRAAFVQERILAPMQQGAACRVQHAAEEAALRAWKPLRSPHRAPAPATPSAPGAEPSPTHAAPLVTALVSAYKSERFLRGCLEDLTRQTLQDRLEIIVVDSGSPQNERAIVEEFQQRHPHIVYLRTDDRETVYAAWNRAIRLARGKYLTNANTDDRHRRDALEILARTLETHPDVTLVYADCLITRTENERFEACHPTGRYRWLEFSPADLLLKGCFCGPQPMWRREVHEEHGLFDPAFVSAGDYEFWLRIARNRKFLHVPQFLGLYLDSPTSVEHANQAVAAREVAEARRRHGPTLVPGYTPPADVPSASDLKRAVTPTRPAEVTLPPCARLGHLGPARQALAQRQLHAAWQAACRALEERPFHPEAALLLAEIAQAGGDAATARLCAQHASRLAPSWKPARKHLKKLNGHSHGKGSQSPRFAPPAALTPGPDGTPPRISVCLIVRNEERFLARCLESIRPLAHQIVVVDTGSTDRTIEIARSFGADVHEVPWTDDFSAARNAALEHATGHWILAIDADEELPSDQHARLLADLGRANVLGCRLPLVNAGLEHEGVSYVPRLFRNAPGLFYVSRVHEQVFSSVLVRAEEWAMETVLGSAQLRHYGYAKDVVRDRQKGERNLRLLRLALAEYPEDANLRMNLGLELIRAGDLDAGLLEYDAALDALGLQPAARHVPELRETLLTQFVTHLLKARRWDNVLRVLESPAARADALSASLHFARGLAHLQLQQPAEAAEAFRLCLARRHLPALCPVFPEILGPAPRHCLATCLRQLGQTDAAREALETALREDPAAAPVRLDLARLHHAEDRPLEALQTLHQLLATDGTQAEVWRLGGEIALSRKEFRDFALDWTGEALKHLPTSLPLARQRAEALLLAGDARGALPLWRSATAATDPTDDSAPRAAVCLCELVAEPPSTAHLVPSTEEGRVSREFLRWYQRLAEADSDAILLQVNEHLDDLARVLPTAARTLRAAIAQAA